MKYAHNIRINIHEYEDNNPEIIEESLKKLIPFEFDTIIQKAEGFNERIIKIISITIDNNSKVNQVLNILFSKLKISEKQIEKRLDGDLNLYIRLDKKDFIDEKYTLIDSGDCIHIKIKIAAFPKKREIAFNLIKLLLDSLV